MKKKMGLSLGFWSLACLAAGLGVSSCGKKSESRDESSAGASKVKTDLKLSLYGVNNSQSSSAKLFLADAGEILPSCGIPYKANWGLSGAPSALKVKLKAINLKSVAGGSGAQAGAGGSTFFKSSESSGTELSLNNGKIDLSALTFEKELTEGVYDQLEFVFRNGAEAAGCLEETVASNENFKCADGEQNADKCDKIDAGKYKFCTRTDKKVTDILSKVISPAPTYTAFLNGTAESVAVPLWNRVNADDKANFLDLDKEYKVVINIPPVQVGDGGTAFEKGQAAYEAAVKAARSKDTQTKGTLAPPKPTKAENSLVLSVLMDLNVLLTFNMNTRNDGEIAFPAFQNDIKGAAFFRLQDLSSYMTAFIGEPGAIEGYQTLHCYNFKNDANDKRVAKNWFTLAFDKEGKILTGTTIPYDSAGFVTFNGDINPSAAAQKPSTKNADGTYDLYIPVTDMTGKVTGHGHIKGFKRAEKVGDTQVIQKENTQTTRLGQGSEDNVNQATVESLRLL